MPYGYGELLSASWYVLWRVMLLMIPVVVCAGLFGQVASEVVSLIAPLGLIPIVLPHLFRRRFKRFYLKAVRVGSGCVNEIVDLSWGDRVVMSWSLLWRVTLVTAAVALAFSFVMTVKAVLVWSAGSGQMNARIGAEIGKRMATLVNSAVFVVPIAVLIGWPFAFRWLAASKTGKVRFEVIPIAATARRADAVEEGALPLKNTQGD